MKRNQKWKVSPHFLTKEPCALAHIRIANQKYNCDELKLAKENRV